MTTAIEWTDETWNPVVGCDRVSPGCDHCYAIGVAHRAMQPAHEGLTIRTERGTDWSGVIRCLPERLEQPQRWRRPRRVFVNSMSDLFHPAVPESFVVDVFAAMANAPQHTFQVLTKRPQLMARTVNRVDFEDKVELAAEVGLQRSIEWCRAEYPEQGEPGWLPNVWLGTSIEKDAYAFRADHLRRTPAAVRFVSLEPLLGPLPSLDLDGIDWVIVGGESGPGARPMHPRWVRDIRDRCVEAGVPFFFKQWGAWGPAGKWRGPDHHLTIDGHLFEPGERLGMNHMADPVAIHRWGKTDAGRELDGRTWDEMPAVAA